MKPLRAALAFVLKIFGAKTPKTSSKHGYRKRKRVYIVHRLATIGAVAGFSMTVVT